MHPYNKRHDSQLSGNTCWRDHRNGCEQMSHQEDYSASLQHPQWSPKGKKGDTNP